MKIIILMQSSSFRFRITNEKAM